MSELTIQTHEAEVVMVTPLLLTIDQAGKLLSIGRTRMFQLIRAGQINSVTIGRSRRVPYASCVDFVNQLGDELLVNENQDALLTPGLRPLGHKG